MDNDNQSIYRKCPDINTRQLQRGQPFKDAIPSSAKISPRSRLVIIADIGKGSDVLEMLAFICYRGLETPHAMQREQSRSSGTP